jgi:TatD DNase family protein
MWIDTHCHLDADEFSPDRDAVVARARERGVSMVVIPPGHVDHFDATAAVAHAYRFAYALGMHPLWIDRAKEEHVEVLRETARAAKADARFVGIGEIGLDFFAPGLDRARQEWFYREQLRIARDLELPVIIHVRRSADVLLKHLRRIDVPGGIAHAFNGSPQQAGQFIERGFRLGFGGAMTYAGSLRIRRFAADLPEDSIVLETDAPDIPPAWLRNKSGAQRNEPSELPRIAATMATLRGIGVEDLAALNRRNACAALPRLATLLNDAPAAG